MTAGVTGSGQAQRFPGRRPPPAGFTFPEIVIVVCLVSMVLLTLFAFFSHGVRTTVKGKDRLDSIRAVTILLARMKEDLANCTAIQGTGPPLILYEEEDQLPDEAVFSPQLTFQTGKRRVTYRQEQAPGGGSSWVERIVESPESGRQSERFGIPRIRTFELCHAVRAFRAGTVPLAADLVFLNLVLDTNDPRFPGSRLNFRHVLVPNRLPGTDWPVLTSPPP